ncbi:MAG: gliding motility lipoprotein GldH [Flavobacteriales bacterium]
MKCIHVFFLFTTVAMFASCDSDVVFEENKSIEKGQWDKASAITFEFEIADTTTLHNMYINLRNGEDYGYSNLYLFAELEFPNGKKATDTVQCFLADPTGKWLGSGMGDIYDNRLIYKERKQFPMAGNYRLSLRQGMRVDGLKGIRDVGVRLAKTE